MARLVACLLLALCVAVSVVAASKVAPEKPKSSIRGALECTLCFALISEIEGLAMENATQVEIEQELEQKICQHLSPSTAFYVPLLRLAVAPHALPALDHLIPAYVIMYFSLGSAFVVFSGCPLLFIKN